MSSFAVLAGIGKRPLLRFTPIAAPVSYIRPLNDRGILHWRMAEGMVVDQAPSRWPRWTMYAGRIGEKALFSSGGLHEVTTEGSRAIR